MQIEKTITYYFPNYHQPSSMKVFQDRSSQVRGFRFKREFLNAMLNEEYIKNYAVYFLFDEDETQVYVGQSKLGAKRISEHCKSKDFWDYCIMFVSDNNVFDSNTIDYMEYYFINLLKDSREYELYNIEQRNRVPNLNSFDKVNYHMYLDQIDFLLKAEGIDFKKNLGPKVNLTNESSNVGETLDAETSKEDLGLDFERTYRAKRKGESIELKLNRDLTFSIPVGTVLSKPSKKMLEWNDNGAAYNKIAKLAERELNKGTIVEKSDDEYVVVSEVKVKSPSAAANLILGYTANGWNHFEGLSEIREIYKKLKDKAES